MANWRPYRTQFGWVYLFERANGRCPAQEFLDRANPAKVKTIEGQFGAIRQMGVRYQNHERFHPLHDEGRPLWEFKAHDHRLYCVREVSGASVTVVLLNGWIKGKGGKANKEEGRQIAQAKNLHAEYCDETKKRGLKPC